VTNANNSDSDRAKDDADEANLGAMLRQAREQRNLSVVDLARCLRLEPRVIERLENNRFDELPAPAFIRGYVRSIAKELDIDSSPLIAVFDLRIRDEPPSILDFESRPPIQITSDSNIIRYTTIALCIVTLMMIALWWQAHDIELPQFTDDSQSDPDTDQVIVPASDPLPYTFDLVQHPDDPFYRADMPTPAADADPEGLDDEGGSSDRALSGASKLVITTREEAWIEIKDAAGTQLHYALAKPGALIEAEGQQPYTLLIGNSPGVTVTFNGKTIDIEPFSEAGIARFELGSGND
jgi:cytoskeleton protein RodZ